MPNEPLPEPYDEPLPEPYEEIRHLKREYGRIHDEIWSDPSRSPQEKEGQRGVVGADQREAKGVVQRTPDEAAVYGSDEGWPSVLEVGVSRLHRAEVRFAHTARL